MVTEERIIALAMAEHLVNALKRIPVARTLWVGADRGTTILWVVTHPFPFDPDTSNSLYEAASVLDDAFPGHDFRYYVLNPCNYATDDPDDHFRSVIHDDAVPFDVHAA